ncbi:MAG: DUF1499 domain-containing protein [Pseudomonadales bacterium]|nr:DUF1499 domain-containing protein [Pseudomonadales bacterium]
MTETAQGLLPCPNSPNCVCSDEPTESKQFIAPYVSTNAELSGEAVTDQSRGQRLLAAVANYLRDQSEFQIIEQTENSLKVEARTSLLRFVDDIDMQVRGERVFVRSASRVGYSDFGKNRGRLEELRARMVEDGMAQPLSK